MRSAGSPLAGYISVPAMPPRPAAGEGVGTATCPGNGGNVPVGAYQSDGLMPATLAPASTFTSINVWLAHSAASPHGTASVYPPAKAAGKPPPPTVYAIT